MDDFKIILFLCNWAPHTAYQTLQDNGYQIPPEVKMVRIPCTGRISKALLFKAFEMGADGVALVGCSPGACRYGTGTEAAMNNTEDTRNILALLGVGRERMQFTTFLPDEAEPLKQFLANFCDDIKKMGKSPVVPVRETEAERSYDESVAAVLAKHDAYSCQDCGKCTSSCPLALSGKEYSPRTLVGSIIAGDTDSEQVRKDIWSCLTCGLCHERCPSDVNFPEFIRDMRCIISKGKGEARQTHGGFFQSLMRAMTSPALKPARWNWLPEEIQLDTDSKTLFFGGCAPYFDAFFKKHQAVKSADILTDSLRLLNFFDVHPRLLDAERCCGHDLLWSGDRENFLRLAKLNAEMISDLGIEEVITSCPECYKTLAVDYEKHGIRTGFKVTHIYEFLEHEIDKGAVTFNDLGRKITYQDSCRLNRTESVRELPRKLIRRLSPDSFEEMKDRDRSALCCGNCAWTGCDAYSKALQVKRIRQAHATGSDLMITSCPKCQIHLRCAMQDPFLGDELRMEMADLTSVIAKTICWE
ncbi:methyl-viologen-reducing hydrogenase subunit del ta [Desulfonema ishimotonii]|uniref:Methyl-viologen-reducing hydrogenase subunit del ta n=1 Tax=Desulfonema ishimotonii TaxID=45657 RepID=A0A401FTG1_9BACT|nr:hydrogenase iron-sulfur subunit [Desulfonema ishimotonii]GBC60243.1 methyl-viologen-reducing hydrogenase subunit del ta [Desulfonema ishimotonii]